MPSKMQEKAVQDAVNRINAGLGTLADRELTKYALDAQEAEMEAQLARQLAAKRFQKNIKESPIELSLIHISEPTRPY